jgi:phage-related protein
MPIVNAVKWFADTIYGIFKTLFGWLIGGSVWTDLCSGIVSVWNSVVMPLVNTVKGFCDTVVGAFSGLKDALSGIWNSIVSGVQSAFNTVTSTISGAVSSAQNALSGFTSSVSGAMSNASNAISGFIGSICFAHAIHNAVESSTKDLDKWVGTVKDSMSKGVESVKGFVAEVGTPTLTVGGVTGVPVYPPVLPVSPTAAPSHISVNITVQGVQEEIADYVRTRLTRELKNTLIEATSSAAPISKKIVLPKTFVR